VPGGVQPDDPAKLAEAKAKADDLEAKLHAGGDFAQLARTFSDGPTASTGGDLGQFRRGALAKVLEDSTFALKAGEYTEPIRTKQGYVILKVAQHVTGGVPAYKDVQEQVEQNFYMARMEPATRDYLTTMREQAFIDIKPGYADTGVSSKETKPVFSAYTPPAPKKKKKVERTRFRESTRTFRQKSPQAAAPETEPAAAPAKKSKKKASAGEAATNSGKKEKIRYGRAPSTTLPGAPQTAAEDLGAVPQPAAEAAPQPANPLEASTRPEKKMRFSKRAKQPKKQKAKGPKTDAQAPSAPAAAEVADRQTQSGPLGLAGEPPAKKKKNSATKGEKTRLADQNQKEKEKKHKTQSDQDSRDLRGW
jgi:peptidyl-prolyl cis-trans isomerase SurA